MPYENIYRSRKTANELVNELVTCQQYNLSVTLTTVALAAMRMLRQQNKRLQDRALSFVCRFRYGAVYCRYDHYGSATIMIRLSVWLVSSYTHVFILLSIVDVTLAFNINDKTRTT